SGTIEDLRYVVSTSPATSQTPDSSWSSAGASSNVTVPGLNMANSGVYYLSVKAKNALGNYFSDITSVRFVVDTVTPYIPDNSFAVTTEGQSVIVSWGNAVVGASQINSYVVEERTAESPIWQTVTSGNFNTFVVDTGSLPQQSLGQVSSGNPGQNITRTPGTYFYRITPVNNAGVQGTPSITVRVDLAVSSVSGMTGLSVYPNPFDSRKTKAKLVFTLGVQSTVSVKIYDIYGYQVTEFSRLMPQGSPAPGSEMEWDGTDSSGQKVSKGIYIAIIEGAGTKTTVKIAVIH
ncbi:MAG: T9SS type A sorting domain-containing protein, partial [Elusimicrobiaceae bacterium]